MEIGEVRKRPRWRDADRMNGIDRRALYTTGVLFPNSGTPARSIA
jgi:hypothetical protein